MKVVLSNDFHNTTVTLLVSEGWSLSPRQRKRAQKALCGMSDCLCSGSLGARGPQTLEGEKILELSWR